MKQVCIIILGLLMTVSGDAAKLYELDMTLELEMFPESGELAKDVPQFMEWAEQQIDPEAKKIYLNSAVNSIVADKMGYKYQIPIKGYVETENGEIKRYRFEHINASVVISSPTPFNQPVITYHEYCIYIHDGKDFYVETQSLSDNSTIKQVFRDEELINPVRSTHWHNYLSYCCDLKQYQDRIAEGLIPIAEDGIQKTYAIREDLEFTMLSDGSTAYAKWKDAGTWRVIARWNRMLQTTDIFVPQLIKYFDTVQQTFTLHSIKDITGTPQIDTLFTIPADAQENNFHKVMRGEISWEESQRMH
ncbi:MAG TPA: hypothetical protein PK878_06195 [bacterium]|nr:hypothetical protein [Candidatus Omnitrophota bacterium]HOJ59858.1 hypothetical protein [bacterium]HOL94342.1 hypothetical protein [bacterium]HPP00737.1 hypothetical protein [bacterium]